MTLEFHQSWLNMVTSRMYHELLTNPLKTTMTLIIPFSHHFRPCHLDRFGVEPLLFVLARFNVETLSRDNTIWLGLNPVPNAPSQLINTTHFGLDRGGKLSVSLFVCQVFSRSINILSDRQLTGSMTGENFKIRLEFSCCLWRLIRKLFDKFSDTS